MKIDWEASPNYRKGRTGDGKIVYLVIHAMIGSYAGSIQWFKNYKAQVSAHYCVSKTGQVTQMVKDEDTAWHVANANPFSIGIELEDLSWGISPTGKKFEKTCMNDPSWYTLSELDTTAELAAELCTKHQIPVGNIIGHNDPILKRYKNNHSDPGPYFPMDKFRTMVKNKMTPPKEAANG